MSKIDSEQLFLRAQRVTPGGVHSPVRSFKGLERSPVFFASGEGAHLTSVEGKRYVDFCMSFGPLILGHRDPEVSDVVQKMIGTAWTFGACEPYSLELAEWITEKIPWLDKVRFVSSGTEAVMSALRVARGFTGRNKILKFEGCYHGHVDSLLVKGGSGLAGVSASSSAGISASTAAETLVAPLGDRSILAEIFNSFGKDIAAVIIEPLPANYGLLIQEESFLRELFSMAKQAGALVIFDEVISGFRVALGGMAEKLNMVPDLVCYGKILGGGFPVGCYGGKKELMDQVAPMGPVYQAGTLSANPVGMVAGLATLKKMERLNGWQALEKRTAAFSQSLNRTFAENGKELQVTSMASLFWIHGLSKNPIRSITAIPPGLSEGFQKLFLASLEKGIYLAPNAYEVGFISMAHTDAILSECSSMLGEFN